MISEILSKVCSLFLIIGTGAAAARFRLLPQDSTPVLNKLLFNVVTPAVVFTTMQGRAFEGQLVRDTVWSFLSYILATLLLGGLSLLLTGGFRVPERDRGIYRMQLVFKNIGFMGIPLAAAVLGERAGLIILLMNVPFVILIYSFGVLLMLYEKGDNPLSGALLRRMLNVPLVCSVLGVVMLAAGWSLPEAVNDGLEMISGAMVPLGMLLVGIQLSRTDLQRVLTPRNLWCCVLSLAVIPALTMGICLLLPQSEAVTATLVFAMAMPAGTMCSMLAEEFGRDTLLASETLMLSTLLSLVTLPVWAVVLTHIYHLG